VCCYSLLSLSSLPSCPTRLSSHLLFRLRTLVQRPRHVTFTILVHNRITILYRLRPVRLVGDSDNHPLLVSVRGDQIAVLIIDVHLLVRPARRLFVLAIFPPDPWLSFLPDAASFLIDHVRQAVFSQRV